MFFLDCSFLRRILKSHSGGAGRIVVMFLMLLLFFSRDRSTYGRGLVRTAIARLVTMSGLCLGDRRVDVRALCQDASVRGVCWVGVGLLLVLLGALPPCPRLRVNDP